jgi:peptidoglycan/LPS O-acetylase OafA/YrhL
LLGVMMFFVHTCLVLMLSLERQTVTNGTDRRAVLFLIRRGFRIYPLSVTVVAIAIVVLFVQGEPPPLAVASSNFLLMQNLPDHRSLVGPLWSLPFEMQMYLVLPGLFLLLERSRRVVELVVGLWGASIVLVLLLWKLNLNYHLFKYLPSFLPGVLAYTLWRSGRRLSPGWLFAYVAGIAFLYPWAVGHGVREHALAWPVCLGLALVIPFAREMETRWVGHTAKIIARYSYGIYLVHAQCIDLGFTAFRRLPVAGQWAIFVGGTSVLSYASYHLIEKPGIDLGRRLTDRLARKARTEGRPAVAEPVGPSEPEKGGRSGKP